MNVSYVIVTLVLGVSLLTAAPSDYYSSDYPTIYLQKAYKYGSLSAEAYRSYKQALQNYHGGGEMSLVYLSDLIYYGYISVGTPSQKIRVLFDTGSAGMWVSSSEMCRTNSQYCRNHKVYRHSKSRTYKDVGTPFQVNYAASQAKGYVSEDNVKLAGLTVTGQKFGEVTQFSENLKFDGIFGLAYPSLLKTNTDSIFLNMVEQGLVDEAVFSFYLHDNEHPQLVLGGADPELYTGDITYAKVIEQKYWKIQIDGINLGSNRVVSGIPVIPDSGSSVIIGSSDVINQINRGIGADTSGKIDCSKVNSLPDISFVISGRSFVLEPDDYIIKDRNSRECSSGFEKAQKLPAMVIGNLFMRKFYTVFDMDNNRVGFATAV